MESWRRAKERAHRELASLSKWRARTGVKVRAATQRTVTQTRDGLSAFPGVAAAYTRRCLRFYRQHPAALRKELLSGFTVAILQVPESVAFSFVAGLNPLYGLYATVFLAFIAGLLAGQPPMISGAAGALAVVLADLTAPGGVWQGRPEAERMGMMLMTIILTGAFQIAAGLAGLARFVKLIPVTAMIGFLNGLAIVVFMSQLTVFQVCRLPVYAECAINGQLEWMSLADAATWIVLFEVALALLITVLFPKIPKVGVYVPASLVALIVVTAFEHGINRTLIHLPARTVGETAPISGGFPVPALPDVGPNPDWSNIVLYGFILGAIGLIESVMTLRAVAEILHEQPTASKSNQECVAQGLANFVCGFFGGMGGDAMIGQSTVNVINGARGRLSASSSGIFMLIFIVALSPAIALIPTPALSGVIFIIIAKTFHWPTFVLLFRLPLVDSFAIVLVTLLGVFTNLAVAVAVGTVWAALVNAYSSGNVLRATTEIVIRPISSAPTVTPSTSKRGTGDGQVDQAPAPNAAQDEGGVRERASDAERSQNQHSGPRDSLRKATGDSVVMVNCGGNPSLRSIPSVARSGTETLLLVKEADREGATAVDVDAGDVAEMELKDLPEDAADRVETVKVYRLTGPLFFGSVSQFASLFDVQADPDHVELDFADSLICDYSAVAAIRNLGKLYQRAGKRVTLRGLSHVSRALVRRAKHALRHISIEASSGENAVARHGLAGLTMLMPVPHFTDVPNDDDAAGDERSDAGHHRDRAGDDGRGLDPGPAQPATEDDVLGDASLSLDALDRLVNVEGAP